MNGEYVLPKEVRLLNELNTVDNYFFRIMKPFFLASIFILVFVIGLNLFFPMSQYHFIGYVSIMLEFCTIFFFPKEYKNNARFTPLVKTSLSVILVLFCADAFLFYYMGVTI